MTVRMSRFGSALAIALVAAAGSLQAQGFRYAPGSASFDVTSKTQIAQEAMGQKQELEITSTQLLTLGLTKGSGDSLALSVRIDSVKVHHSVAGDVDTKAMQGVTVNAQLARDGQLRSVQPVEGLEDTQADQLARLMPRVRGALKVGSVWVDTIAGDVTQSGLTMQRRIITTARVVGDTVANGEKAWRIAREAQLSVAGSGEVQGQTMSVEGTGSGTGTWVVSGKGLFMGATLNDRMTTKVVLAANGIEVNGTTSAATTVTRRQ